MTTPYRVPMGEPGATSTPAAPAPSSAGGMGKLGALLKTRNGKLGAAGGAVVAIALYERHKSSAAAAATASDGTSGAGSTTGTSAAATGSIPTDDTTDTDLYNTLEPLIEKASGFTDASSIEAQLAAQQATLTKLAGATPATTSTGTGTTYGGKEIAAGGSSVLALFKKMYPTANNTQLQQLLADAEHDPRNASSVSYLQKGALPAGKSTKLYLPSFTGSK